MRVLLFCDGCGKQMAMPFKDWTKSEPRTEEPFIVPRAGQTGQVSCSECVLKLVVQVSTSQVNRNGSGRQRDRRRSQRLYEKNTA
jgi:hypothetical protein